jgi:hypothetical protein
MGIKLFHMAGPRAALIYIVMVTALIFILASGSAPAATCTEAATVKKGSAQDIITRLANPALIARMNSRYQADMQLVRDEIFAHSNEKMISGAMFETALKVELHGTLLTIEIPWIAVSSIKGDGVAMGEREGSLNVGFSVFLTALLSGVKEYLHQHPGVTSVRLSATWIVNPFLTKWLTEHGFQRSGQALSLLINAESLR